MLKEIPTHIQVKKGEAFASAEDENMEPATWREIMPYYLGLAVFVISILSEIYFGNFFILIWISYVFLPIMDYILPVDHSNIPEGRVRALEKDKRFLAPLYLVWIIDVSVLFWAIYQVSKGEIG